VDFIGSPLSSFRELSRKTVGVRFNSRRKNQALVELHRIARGPQGRLARAKFRRRRNEAWPVWLPGVSAASPRKRCSKI